MGYTVLAWTQSENRLSAGLNDEDKEEIKREVLSIFDAIGIPQQEQEAILNKAWHPLVEYDYVSLILGLAEQKRRRQKIADCDLPWNRNTLKNLLPPDDIAAALKRCGLLTPQMEGFIEDYSHYRKFREHRRPEVWAKRNDWGEMLE